MVNACKFFHATTSKLNPRPGQKGHHGCDAQQSNGAGRLNPLGEIAQVPRQYAKHGNSQPQCVPCRWIRRHGASPSQRPVKVLLSIIRPLLFRPTGGQTALWQRRPSVLTRRFWLNVISELTGDRWGLATEFWCNYLRFDVHGCRRSRLEILQPADEPLAGLRLSRNATSPMRTSPAPPPAATVSAPSDDDSGSGPNSTGTEWVVP